MVSVLVPIYNAEKYLKECLESLHNQTLKDIEFILVNDGSTDNSQSIVDEYCRLDNRFKSYIKENGGQVSAYLFGFTKSKGDYIGFVDSDDIARNDMFEKLHKTAKENDADIVICNRVSFKDDISSGKEDEIILDTGLYKDADIKKVWDVTLPAFNKDHRMHNSRWNKLFKREIFEKNIKYTTTEAKTLEDRFIVISSIFSAKSIYILNENLYYYRLMDISSKSKPRADLYKILNLLFDKQKEMLIDYGLYEEYKSQYELACLDYLSLFIRRNILGKKKFKDKVRYTKLFMNNKFIRQIIKNNKKELTGKLGKALKICTGCKLVITFSLLSYLV